MPVWTVVHEGWYQSLHPTHCSVTVFSLRLHTSHARTMDCAAACCEIMCETGEMVEKEMGAMVAGTEGGGEKGAGGCVVGEIRELREGERMRGVCTRRGEESPELVRGGLRFAVIVGLLFCLIAAGVGENMPAFSSEEGGGGGDGWVSVFGRRAEEANVRPDLSWGLLERDNGDMIGVQVDERGAGGVEDAFGVAGEEEGEEPIPSDADDAESPEDREARRCDILATCAESMAKFTCVEDSCNTAREDTKGSF